MKQLTDRDRTVIARQLEQGVAMPPGTEVVYDGYKEPLRPVPNGHGYLGAIGRTSDRRFVECNICGYLFRNLGHHLRRHDITVAAYREEIGLTRKSPLIGADSHEKILRSHVKRFERHGLVNPLIQYNQDLSRGVVPPRKRNYTLEEQNRKGVCPDQTLDRIQKMIDRFGRVPSYEEYRAYYQSRYITPIYYHFGSWDGATNALGLRSRRQEYQSITRDELIGHLQAFHREHGRVPMNSDFKRGITVGRYHYYKHFGSLNEARVAAGLNAIIPSPTHPVELTPEQYFEYSRIRDSHPKRRRWAGLGGMDKVLGLATS